jgi:hypothetical protein
MTQLAAARTLAWALWLGGWLVLGGFGHRHLPLLAGGLAPLALWLVCIGLLLAVPRPLSPRWLAFCLVTGAVLAAAGLWWARAMPLACGWALLLVAASRVVKRLRRDRAPNAPLAPAAAGALLAWVMAGDPTALALQAVALALLLAALVLTVLLPRLGAVAPGCRAGLFDCALPLAALAPWRIASQWPQQAALLAMLPMMAALPAAADWCSTSGWPPRAVTAAHLAAMLLPPWLLRHLGAEARRVTIATLLLAGGAALWLQPSVQGLMSAALLHGTAWGLAWGGLLAAARAPTTAVRPTPAPAGAVAAILLWTLGWALHHGGPAALMATHGLLALCGALGLLVGPYKQMLASMRHRYS